MRFFVSKSLGHGLGVGLSGSTRRAPAQRNVTPAVVAAISKAEQAHAELERCAADMGRNAAHLQQRVATHEATLERLKASYAQGADAMHRPMPAEMRLKMSEAITKIKEQIAATEASGAKLKNLLRTAVAGYEDARRRVAANRAALDAKIARM